MVKKTIKPQTGDVTESQSFLHIFVNSPIDGRLYGEIMRVVNENEKNNSCAVLTLITLGGSANDAYRIGRFLQMRFKNLYVHVPTICASAGTLLVCAGHKLIISGLSELGPLDAQILKSDELYSRRSSLVVRSLFENLGEHAFELHTSLIEKIIDHSGGTIKYKTAATVASEMVVGLLHGLYEQINPEQIGEDYRFLRVSEEYGKRLAEKGGNISESRLHQLVYDFPAHDFIIDFREAMRIFNEVGLPGIALINDISSETEIPLDPLGSKERVVKAKSVNGAPIHEENANEKVTDDNTPTEQDGSRGSPSS